jgi:hypothetical protein
MAGLKAFIHSSLLSWAQFLHKSVGERGEELGQDQCVVNEVF